MSRNLLGEENSPYLLQHRHNPVWWRPWGEEAFREARERGLPVFLSVGYSTCHWCHVMERESFEDQGVAGLLNQGFVSIKVDREERPDVDAFYMDAVQALAGHGGWPMSVWLTPEGRPFFGGTYFPRERFLELLERIRVIWNGDPQRIEQMGRELTEGLRAREQRERAGSLDQELLIAFFEQARQRFDPLHGGYLGAPKFPHAYDIQLLLRLHRRTGDGRALQIARRTLCAMAAGGIYDHLAGGFHRYSTDERWFAPHFEKMLYDQASLATAYLEAWEATGEEEFRLVCREILDYVLRDMTHPEGGFFSAEDADAEGQEGKYYVWTAEEMRSVLTSEECREFGPAFGVTEGGNWEQGTNILNLQPGHTRAGRSSGLAGAMQRLSAQRARRVRPHQDDKILADWNGLMIAALARAGRSLDEPRYTAAAARAARFVLERCRDGQGRLLHRWRDGRAGIGAFLDDHAFLIHALIELYQADFDGRWLARALELQALQDELFFDRGRRDYLLTDGSNPWVPVRRTEPFDNVVPSGRSVSALNLLRLERLLGRQDLGQKARDLFASTPEEIKRFPAAFVYLLLALDFATDRSHLAVVAGAPGDPEALELVRTLRQGFHPNRLVAAPASPPGTTPAAVLERLTPASEHAAVFFCEEGACQKPLFQPTAVAAQGNAYCTRLGRPKVD